MHSGAEEKERPGVMAARVAVARRRMWRALALPLIGRWLSGAGLIAHSAGVAALEALRSADGSTRLPPAGDWNGMAFGLHTEAQVLAALRLPGSPRSGPELILRAPEIAENGAVVPIEVQTTLQDVRRVVIVVPANPNALVADFRFGKRARPVLATRIKLAGTCEVIALVQTGDVVWRAQQMVKVTLGGCGG